MTDRFGYAKANKLIFSSYIIRERYTGGVFSILNVARYLEVNDQFRTPLHTFAGSIDLSGLSFFALSSKTSVVSG